MKTYPSSVLSVCLIIAISFFLTEKGFSQTGKKADTISSHNAMPNSPLPIPSGITSGRARSLAGGVLGLIGLIAGWMAKSRSTKGTGNARSLAIAAVILGSICLILSMVHLATTPGGFGTGGGKAGAIVSLVPGAIGAILGSQALRTKK